MDPPGEELVDDDSGQCQRCGDPLLDEAAAEQLADVRHEPLEEPRELVRRLECVAVEQGGSDFVRIEEGEVGKRGDGHLPRRVGGQAEERVTLCGRQGADHAERRGAGIERHPAVKRRRDDEARPAARPAGP